MAWVQKSVATENYVREGDIREIVDIVEPHDELDESTGEIKHRKAAFILAGPKGGRWTMSLPDYYWESNPDVIVGDGFSEGGWRVKKDDEGKPIIENGQFKMVFIRPKIFQKED